MAEALDDLWFVTPCQRCEHGDVLNCLDGEAWVASPRRVRIAAMRPCRDCGWRPEDIDDPI